MADQQQQMSCLHLTLLLRMPQQQQQMSCLHLTLLLTMPQQQQQQQQQQQMRRLWLRQHILLQCHVHMLVTDR
jgi:hypothetical protein